MHLEGLSLSGGNMELPGGLELLIILFIILLIFGVGRISGLAGEVGKSISEFRKGLRGEGGEEEKPKTDDAGKKG
jgi:sec-independent protein translocase protein TatA